MADWQSKEKNPAAAMKPLEVLIGAWDVLLPDDSGAVGAPMGRATFEWMAGGHYLIQRAVNEPAEFPDILCIIGYDEANGNYTQHYFDSRGVARIYHMTLTDKVWQLWRNDADFPQRYSGTFSEDGSVISGQWERSDDGTNWALDFHIVLRKVELLAFDTNTALD